MIRLLSVVMALLLMFTPLASAQSKVWVDPRVDDWVETYQTIDAVLEPDDNVMVDVYYEGPLLVRQGVTHIVSVRYEVFVYADADIPQREAIKLLESVEGKPVDKIVSLIHRIHDWQE